MYNVNHASKNYILYNNNIKKKEVQYNTYIIMNKEFQLTYTVLKIIFIIRIKVK